MVQNLLLAQASPGFEATHTYSWTKEDIRATGEEREYTIGAAGDNGKLVKPGKRWKVFQIAGMVGYWNIHSMTIKSCDCDCDEECSPQDDHSCSTMEIPETGIGS